MSKQTQFHIKSALLVAALGIVIGQSWGELVGQGMIAIAIALTVIGYWFGKITCAEHDHPGRGIALSIGLFVILNGTHSLIDGVSLATSDTSWFAVIVHELVRQLALYGVVLGMIAPFKMEGLFRYLSAFIAVSIVWVLGMVAGEHAAAVLASFSWIHSYLAAASFLLVGDIVHHIWDEYRYIKSEHRH